MLTLEQVDAIVREVATRHLAALGVTDVASEPTVDSQGDEALRITITVQSGKRVGESGGPLLDTLSEISTLLQQGGDPRFPIIEYAAEDEPNVDDSES